MRRIVDIRKVLQVSWLRSLEKEENMVLIYCKIYNPKDKCLRIYIPCAILKRRYLFIQPDSRWRNAYSFGRKINNKADFIEALHFDWLLTASYK